MFLKRSIAGLILILYIKQVSCKVTDNTDIDDEALFEGELDLSSGRHLAIRSDDEAPVIELSCIRDHPAEMITWGVEREDQTVEIWSSIQPDAITNADEWNVMMTDNEAVLTLKPTQKSAVYMCSHGSYKEMIEVPGQVFKTDDKNEVLISENGQSLCDENTEWTCNSGMCIPIEERCDTRINCDDWSDEDDCFDDCPGFTCDNGRCTASSVRCNGIRNCADGSDNRDCFDDCTRWTCDNGQCTLESHRCDGREDCDDGSDEWDCDVWCMEPARRCNGWQDCEDGGDEVGCVCDEETQFECSSGGCIRTWDACNRRVDCTDGSDEKGCECREGYWTCDSGQCVYSSNRCDGSHVQCSDGSDEVGCEHGMTITAFSYFPPNRFHEFTCRINRYKIPLAWKCDGIDDCIDAEDEQDCSDITTLEYPERPTTVDDIKITEATTQVPLGDIGSHIDHPQCPLPDCAFISSSDFFSCTGPDQARIDAQDAWVAHPDENLPFLQIDLFRDVTVESIVTRGNGFNDEWTTVYSVAYRRDGSSSWIQDPAFYFGNVDPNTPFINHLNNGPVSARYWRIYPLSFVGQRALRVDLLGPLDNCQGDFTCPSDKSHRLPLIANPECPLPLSQITSSSTLVRCSNAIQGVLPMVTGTCDTEELTPVQSPRLCNSWIPRADDTDSFIQFDLGQPTEVFEIITQGRGELINEFVNSYRVSYSDDGDNFYFIIDHILDQPQIFPGNTDSWSLVSNRVTTLPNPEGGRVARYWRIHPVGFVGQPGLKVELLGIRDCP